MPTGRSHENWLRVEQSLSPEVDETVAADGFELHLDNFDGPFDLLLTLIGNRKLDVTELALSAVTGEFISYVSKLEGA